MKASLQQQLVAAQAERLGNLGVVLLEGGDKGLFGLVGAAMEVAELAPRQADVRDVHVAVDLPGHHLGIGAPAAQRVGNPAQFGNGGLFVEGECLVRGNPFAGERFGIEFFQFHGFDSVKDKNSEIV